MDNDDQILEAAAAAVTKVDVTYKGSGLAGKVALKDARDGLFRAYADARMTLLEDAVLATDEDVAEMQAIKREIDEAADKQLLAGAALKGAQLLMKFV